MPTTAPAADPFQKHLLTSLKLHRSEAPNAGDWADAGNTLGMIALRLSLLTLEQIDEILELQEQRSLASQHMLDADTTSSLFGQLAIERGDLTSAQVKTLLEIQRINRRLEIGERLVVAGKLDLTTLIQHLSEFMQSRAVSC